MKQTMENTIDNLHSKSHQCPTFRTNICTSTQNKQFFIFLFTSSLPTTKSHIIIISHINIKDKFTFDWIKLCCRKHFMIFGLKKKNNSHSMEEKVRNVQL